MSVDRQASEERLLNPFPGLRSFEPEEEHLFFGRETQIDELLTRLRKTRFLTVVGTSGSGKSSIVRSGLIPSLHGGYMVHAGSGWRIAVHRPGDDPIGNLATALNDPDVLAPESGPSEMGRSILDATLRRGDRGLVEAVRQAHLPPGDNLLVVVDQFEELFRFKRSRRKHSSLDESTAFVNCLLKASRQQEVPIFVVLTMRSDFLGNCTEFNELPEAINEGLYLIPRMLREQRRMAICGPVAVGGAEISQRLVLRLLNDVGDDPDQLPILQHALMRTWDYWADNHTADEPLDLRHYEAIGRMSEALSLHAEEAFSGLASDRGRECAEGTFKNLTEMGADGRGIRRPMPLDDLCSATDSTPEEIIEVVEAFRRPGRSFLAPPTGVPLDGDTVIDISHESLMRVWIRLKGWADEEARSAQLYQRLAAAAEHHQEGRAGLWRDPELQAALTWAETARPTAIWALKYNPSFERAMIFLRLSREAREREAAHKELVRKQQLTRTRRFAMVLGSAAFIMLFVGLYAFMQKGKADEERVKAEAAQVTAEAARGQAETAQLAAEQAAERANAERVTALEQRARAESSEREARRQREMAEFNEREALRQSRIAGEQREAALEEKSRADREAQAALAAKEAAEKSRRAAELSEQRAAKLRLLELARSLALQVEVLKREYGAQAAAQVALKAFQLHLDNGGSPRRTEFYDALRAALAGLDADRADGSAPASLDRSFPGHLDAVRAVAVSPARNVLASGDDDGGVHLLDLANLVPARGKHQQVDSPVRAIAFDAAGTTLAIGALSGAVYLWDLESNDMLRLAPVPASAVVSLAFSQSGDLVAAASADGSLRLWQGLPQVEGQYLATQLPDRPTALAFDETNSRLLIGGQDGSLFAWDLKADQPKAVELLSSSSGIRSLAIDGSGSRLAVGNRAGLIEVRDLVAGGLATAPLIGHRSSVNQLSFSPDSQSLVSAGSDGKVNIWHLAEAKMPPIALLGHGTWVWAAAFSPDGRFILSAGADNQVRRWPARAEDLATQVCSHIDRPLSEEQWREIFPPDQPYEDVCESTGSIQASSGSPR